MQADKQLPVIGITMGDPVGIGPEILIKALASADLYGFCRPVVFGDMTCLEREKINLKASVSLKLIETIQDSSFSTGIINIFAVSSLDPATTIYARPSKETSRAMAEYIVQAVNAALEQKIDALVTAPINKKSLQDSGCDYPGHTEMLADLTGAEDVVMMLAGKKLRVVLVTIHCPLSRVPQLLDSDKILKTISVTHKSLKTCFSISSPKLAVAALNPHAGENGLFGTEEMKIIMPAIKEAREKGLDVTGPFPSDTIFYQAAQGKFDAVVCMYHDQGLIPLKLLHFDDGVNVTLGLPIIRTSVDHGTAYDIAGKGIASPASLISAVKLAAQMAKA